MRSAFSGSCWWLGFHICVVVETELGHLFDVHQGDSEIHYLFIYIYIFFYYFGFQGLLEVATVRSNVPYMWRSRYSAPLAQPCEICTIAMRVIIEYMWTTNFIWIWQIEILDHPDGVHYYEYCPSSVGTISRFPALYYTKTSNISEDSCVTDAWAINFFYLAAACVPHTWRWPSKFDGHRHVRNLIPLAVQTTNLSCSDCNDCTDH